MRESGELTNRLAILRAEHGLSQNDVAKKVGVSRQTIISIEKNRYNPSLKLAFELAKLFEVGLEEIFQYE